MAKTETFDVSKAMENFFGAFSMESMGLEGAAKNVAELNVKMTKIALDTAKANVALSSKWANETLKAMEAQNTVPASAADFATTASEFAQAQAQVVPQKVTEFVEVAKKAQVEATELLTAAGKDLQAEVASAAKAKAA